MRKVILALSIIVLFCICAGFQLYAAGYRTGTDEGFAQGTNYVHETRKDVSESLVSMGFKDWCRHMADPGTIVDTDRREEAVQLCYDVLYYEPLPNNNP